MKDLKTRTSGIIMIFFMYTSPIYISCIGKLIENVSPEFIIPTIWGIIGQNIPGWLSILVSVSIAIYVTNRSKKSTERHIKAVENASVDQVKETRYWIDLKRKQLLKSVISELKLNMDLFEEILDSVQNGKYLYRVDDFNLIIMEKCLTDTPIEDDRINSNLINMYSSIKISRNRMRFMRGDYGEKGMRQSSDKIVYMYNTNIKSGLEMIIRDLEAYEQSITLYPLDTTNRL